MSTKAQPALDEKQKIAQQSKNVPVYANMLCGSIAGCNAEIFTIPIDTAKVRLQIQGQNKGKPGYVQKYNGMFHALKTIYAEEGVLSLWKGIFAGLQRQCLFAGIRIGIYPSVRDFYMGSNKNSDPSFLIRVLAAMTTGAIGITIACPTDVVKIRLQAEGRKPPGEPVKYTGSIDAYQKIIANEGVKTLWSGLAPNILRNSIMNAAELASYDQLKTSFLKRFPNVNPENKLLHFTCGFSAGFIAVCFASPMDVVKTRIMNSSKGVYSGMLDCCLKTMRNEGPLAFYGGFVANFSRVGTWNIICFLTLEQCQKYARQRYNH